MDPNTAESIQGAREVGSENLTPHTGRCLRAVLWQTSADVALSKHSNTQQLERRTRICLGPPGRWFQADFSRKATDRKTF